MKTRSLILTFIAVNGLLWGGMTGCTLGANSTPEYRHVKLQATSDPLSPDRGTKAFPAWTPPKQMAVWVHPHRDANAEALIGGHWILLLLGNGRWYTETPLEQAGVDRDPVPDAEATPEEIDAGRSSLLASPNAVIPYRAPQWGPGEKR